MFDQEGFSISANERNRSAIVPPSALTVSHRFWGDLFSLTTGEVFASNCGVWTDKTRGEAKCCLPGPSSLLGRTWDPVPSFRS